MTTSTAHKSLATIPQWILRPESASRTQKEVAAFAGGVLSLALLAQIQFPLPWTPVPITGQTFGVALISLLFGRHRAFSIVASYLILGGIGLPFFATAANFGLNLSPTLGYLIGMGFSSLIVGELSDRGWSQNFYSAFFAAQIGSLAVFTCGLTVLSMFVPGAALLTAGLWPFIPGDIIKNLIAARLATRLNSKKS